MSDDSSDHINLDDMLENPPFLFGDYFVLDKIRTGKTSSIYRGWYLSDDFEQLLRPVCLKIHNREVSKNKKNMLMFYRKIKGYENIENEDVIEINDFGKINGRLFVAMEYADGQSLNSIMKILKKKKQYLPLPITLYIISKVCDGISYVHEYNKENQKRLESEVHANINPDNIMITYDGKVKVLGAGINKDWYYEENIENHSLIKMLPYYSPELFSDEDIDCKSDQYSIGILLWELLTGKRLFPGDDEFTISKAIKLGKVTPPHEINKNIPEELSEIALKALSEDKDKRFSMMKEFGEKLKKMIVDRFQNFNNNQLVLLGKKLFQEEIEKDRKKLKEFGEIDINAYLEKTNILQYEDSEDVIMTYKTGSLKNEFNADDETLKEIKNEIKKSFKGWREKIEERVGEIDEELEESLEVSRTDIRRDALQDDEDDEDEIDDGKTKSREIKELEKKKRKKEKKQQERRELTGSRQLFVEDAKKKSDLKMGDKISKTPHKKWEKKGEKDEVKNVEKPKISLSTIILMSVFALVLFLHVGFKYVLNIDSPWRFLFSKILGR